MRAVESPLKRESPTAETATDIARQTCRNAFAGTGFAHSFEATTGFQWRPWLRLCKPAHRRSMFLQMVTNRLLRSNNSIPLSERPVSSVLRARCASVSGVVWHGPRDLWAKNFSPRVDVFMTRRHHSTACAIAGSPAAAPTTRFRADRRIEWTGHLARDSAEACLRAFSSCHSSRRLPAMISSMKEACQTRPICASSDAARMRPE